jgi:hypothetical protein
METTIENPVIKDDSTEQRDQLRGMAEEAGPLSGNEFEFDTSSATETETRAPVETEKETVSSPDTKPEITEKPERPRDELGRFTKTEAGVDIPEADRKPAEQKPEAKPEETKTETAYAKAAKEQERQKSLLVDFEKKKAEFRAESDRVREQLRQEAAELQRARQQRQAPSPTQPQGTRYTSSELVEAAGVFEANAEKAFADADEQAFKDNLNLARNARQQAGEVYQLEQQAQQQATAHQFQTMYAQVMDQTVRANPDLAKADSELSKDVQVLLEQEAVFSHIPDGFAKAVQVSKWKLASEKSAGLISGLEEENKNLKAENARLNGNLSLNGSGPSGPVPTKRFEDMSMDEMKRTLRGVAEEAGSLATA